jgi:hypothetical protein
MPSSCCENLESCGNMLRVLVCSFIKNQAVVITECASNTSGVRTAGICTKYFCCVPVNLGSTEKLNQSLANWIMFAVQPWTNSLLQLAESFASKRINDLGFRHGVNGSLVVLGCYAA